MIYATSEKPPGSTIEAVGREKINIPITMRFAAVGCSTETRIRQCCAMGRLIHSRAIVKQRVVALQEAAMIAGSESLLRKLPISSLIDANCSGDVLIFRCAAFSASAPTVLNPNPRSPCKFSFITSGMRLDGSGLSSSIVAVKTASFSLRGAMRLSRTASKSLAISDLCCFTSGSSDCGRSENG